MIVDFVAILLVLGACLWGWFKGFGKMLKTLCKGFLGLIISLVACYFLFGIVLNIPFVQGLLSDLVIAIDEKNSKFLDFLLKIRIDLIVYAVCLFIVITIVRKIVVKIIASIFEVKVKPISVFNRVMGMLLSLIIFAATVLIAFQVIAWVTGLDGGIYEYLEGSFLKLDWVYQNNPLNTIVASVDLNNFLKAK